MEYKDYDDFMAKYGPVENPSFFDMLAAHLSYYEGIGSLVYKKLIDIELVSDLYSSLVTSAWDKIESFVLEYRKRNDVPRSGEYMEYLAEQLQPYRKRIMV